MSAPRLAPLVRVLVLLALLIPAAPGVHAEDAPDAEPNFVERALANLTLGDGIQTDQVILFPLIVASEPEDLEVKASTATGGLEYVEPEFPSRRYDLEARNRTEVPILILGGMVLEGGHRDRFVIEDALVAPGAQAELRCLPAASTTDIRDEAATFYESETLGTSYLRESAQFGASSSLVPVFVTHFFDFRNDGDERRSLVAINESSLLEEYCLVCHQSVASFPKPSTGREVVGLVTAIRGRIQSLELFGTNLLLHSYFEPILKGHTFAAAAIELRAKKARVPLPGAGNPEVVLEEATKAAKKLVEQLRKASFRADTVGEGQAGTAVLIRTPDGTRGRAIALNDNLVHLNLFPYDPFEHALYSRALRPQQEGEDYDPTREGTVELERRRRGGSSRLTEAERRILERLRDRRPGIGPISR